MAAGDNGDIFGITNNKDATRSETFAYDALNRLISAQNASDGTCDPTTADGKSKSWGNSYLIDAWGNLVAKQVTKCSSENLTVSAGWNNQLQGGYVYDAAGNMTFNATSGQTYSYDPENRFIGANGFAYTYDAAGNRVEKSNGSIGTLYWYLAPGIIAESDLSGNLQSEYVFFAGKRIARKDLPGNAVSYYFSDRLKTASVITDSIGNIKAESDYYPWGGELQLVNNDTNHYKFTGKERDGETGLDYLGARYYSNGLGRFVTPDWSAKPEPVPYARLRDPQSLNLYSYVENRPTVMEDPDGHEVSGTPCPGGADECTMSSTTVETNDGHAWITTRTEHHWVDNDGNPHTSIAYTTVHAVNLETDGGSGGKFGIVSVSQTTTAFAGSTWQEGKVESTKVRSWNGDKELTANNNLGLQVAGRMVGFSTIANAALSAGPSILGRAWNAQPGDIMRDYKKHPHYYHGAVVGALSLPVGYANPWVGLGWLSLPPLRALGIT